MLRKLRLMQKNSSYIKKRVIDYIYLPWQVKKIEAHAKNSLLI